MSRADEFQPGRFRDLRYKDSVPFVCVLGLHMK